MYMYFLLLSAAKLPSYLYSVYFASLINVLIEPTITGRLASEVYRKKMHTDHYLNAAFNNHRVQKNYGHKNTNKLGKHHIKFIHCMNNTTAYRRTWRQMDETTKMVD